MPPHGHNWRSSHVPTQPPEEQDIFVVHKELCLTPIGDQEITVCSFLLWYPRKVPSTNKLIQARLGVSRMIYVNVDSPNLGFQYQWEKTLCITIFKKELIVCEWPYIKTEWDWKADDTEESSKNTTNSYSLLRIQSNCVNICFIFQNCGTP